MATLVTLQGPNPGRHFRLGNEPSLIGRQPNAAVYLDSLAVSRQHARVVRAEGAYFIEDLGSSNGTYLNGRAIDGRMPLSENDTLQIGPYVLALRPDPAPPKTEPDQIIRTRVAATPSNHTLFLQNPAYKLQAVLEIAHTLARTLEMEPLLGKLLDHLLRLFPQADRGLVLLCEQDRLILRAVRGRRTDAGESAPYSRTVVRRALEEGVGILSQDVSDDPKLVLSQTLVALNLRSFLCVPLIAPDGRRQGVIQLDCSTSGMSFSDEDLEVLTAIALQVSVVLENAALHAARIEEEKLHQELAVAARSSRAICRPTSPPWAMPASSCSPASIRPGRCRATCTTSSPWRTGGWRSSSATSRARGCRPPCSWWRYGRWRGTWRRRPPAPPRRSRASTTPSPPTTPPRCS